MKFNSLGEIEDALERVYERMEEVLDELKVVAPEAAAADSKAKELFARKLVSTLKTSEKQPMAMREAFARLDSSEKDAEARQLEVQVRLLRDELNMLNSRVDSLRTMAANTRRIDGGKN